jgi:glutaredoxin
MNVRDCPQSKAKKQLVVRKDVDVNERERLPILFLDVK